MQTWAYTMIYKMVLSIVEVMQTLVHLMVLVVVVGLVFASSVILQGY